MTEGHAPVADVSDAMRALLRRAGHELRNAQSAASVNLEVVRSRVAAGRANEAGLESFAENAAKGLNDAARIGEAIIALSSAVTTAQASGALQLRDKVAGGTVFDIPMSGSDAERLLAAVGVLSERIKLGVERTESGVILRIPPNYETD